MSAANPLGKYQPYPEYKDSGVEWLGKLPVGWEVKRLKYLAPLVTNKASNRTNPIGLENIESWTGRFISTDSEFQGEGTGFISGDILFGKLRPYLAKALLAEFSGEAVGDFHVLRPTSSVNNRYLQYQILTKELISIIDGSTFGAKMPRVSWDFMADICCAYPSEVDAATIAAFLDYETARIDQLIAKQQQLIELLKEKRQAVISHAVTKGLNPNAPMKDSGVEWLGQVPEHWVVKRLKHISPKIGVGLVINPSTYVKDDGVYFLFGGDIEEYGFKLEKTRKMSDEDSRSLPQSRLNEGDLVCVRVGYPGITAVIPKLLCGSNCASMMVVRRGLYDSHWLAYCMNSDIGRKQVELVQYGAAQKQYNIADAIEFYFAVPPLAEQKQISEYLYDKRKKFNSLITNAENIIALLQERRTALISAAVTGKIDLRGWQPPKREVAA